MEFRTLQLILEHCLPPARLKRVMPEKPEGRDWYEAAADEILNETPVGAELTNLLDTESRPQQAKIRSMKVAELRDNLSPEFLEPGKTLGLILWALLSDERLSARTLADQLAEQFHQLAEENAVVDEGEEDDESVPSISLDRQIAEMNEAQAIQSDEDEADDSDLDLDALLEDIRTEEADEEEMEEDLNHLLDEEPEEEEEFPIEEETPVEPVEINDDLLNEVDTFIASLDRDEMDRTAPVDDREEIEEELDVDAILRDTHFGETESDRDEDIGEYPDSISKEDEEIIGMEITGEGLVPLEEIEPLEEFEFPEETVDIEGELESVEDFEEDETIATPVYGSDQSAHLPVPTVQLGGITISLSSLKRACESVFTEPVELVTDENLIRQDQIVVVGRQCGVRILHGPTWTQPLEPTRECADEPVTINPVSLQLALTRIYGEPVELIPDPNLLMGGIILFAGKSAGLGILENQRARVSLPDWAWGKVESEVKIPANIAEEIANLREKIETDARIPAGIAEEINDLREQIDLLASRIQSLEETPPISPIAIQQDFPVRRPEPEIESEPEPDYGSIAETPISVSEIETEELEPFIESPAEGDSFEEDAIAGIAYQEEAVGEESEEEEFSLGELNLDELNLDEIADETDEDSLELEQEESEDEEIEATQSLDDTEEIEGIAGLEEIEGIEGLDLGDSGEENLALDELESLGIGAQSAEEDSGVGSEELNLDDLDLDSLESFDTGEEGEEDAVSEEADEEEIVEEIEEGIEEETEEEETELADVDLGDILSELDSEESETGEAPEPVFNGETILLLGGEKKNRKEYKRVVEEIGGNCLWYGTLREMPEGEIAGLVEQARVVMTLTAEAITDPGILQATNYAEEQRKPVVQHHSSNPASVQKQLIKGMTEGFS